MAATEQLVGNTPPALGSGPIDGLAAMGKTSIALVLVIVVIWLCSLLVKRLGNYTHTPAKKVRVVSSTSVGQRERVVVVEIEQTWLVLGVGNGQVSKLHQMDTPPEEKSQETTHDAAGFAHHLSKIINSKNAR